MVGIGSGSTNAAVTWLLVEAGLVVSLAATRRAQEVAEPGPQVSAGLR